MTFSLPSRRAPHEHCWRIPLGFHRRLVIHVKEA